MRDFGLCRICFRELANEGMLPGVRKSSWQENNVRQELPWAQKGKT